MTLMAAPVSKQQAQQVAAQLLGSKQTARRVSSTLQVETVFGAVNATGDAYLYAVSQGDGEGFVIVSGDDRYQQVLGYSDSGTFDMDSMPEEVRWWLQGYIREMQELEVAGYESTTEHRAVPEWTAIAPMIETQWHQHSPFCDNCPVISGFQVPAGCQTIAMAQVLTYWGRKTGLPAGTLVPIPGYESQMSHMTIEELPVTTFDWTKIRNVYDDTATAEECAEVAKLTQYCAIALKSEFSLSTVSNAINAPSALMSYFGFDKTAALVYRYMYTMQDWLATVYHELEEGRPVIYSGSTTVHGGVGHAIVVDGYDGDGLFHINFGHGGIYNCYYALSVMDYYSPDIKNPPVASSSFTNGVSAVIGAQIGTERPATSLPTALMSGVTAIEGTTVTASYSGFGVPERTYDYGLAWMDATGVLELIVTESAEFSLFVNKSITHTVQPTDKSVGRHKLVPVSRASGSAQWIANRSNYVVVEFDGTGVTVSMAQSVLKTDNFEFMGSKCAEAPQSVIFTLHSDGPEWYGMVKLYASSTDKRGEVQSYCWAAVPEDGSHQVKLSFTPPTPGTYNLWVVAEDLQHHTTEAGMRTVVIAEATVPVVTFFSTNRPAGCPDLTATIDDQPVASGSSVQRKSLMKITATEVAGYHINWYKNGVWEEPSASNEFLCPVLDDCIVEARYVGDSVTTIEEVREVLTPESMSVSKDNNFYTIGGMKVGTKSAQKGVYIRGNKKVVVK